EIDGKRDADGEHVATRGGEHVADFSSDRAGDLLRPGRQQDACDLVGELLGAEVASERSHENEEREQRHQHGQRDVARNCPPVVVIETVEGIKDGAAELDRSHEQSPAMRVSLNWRVQRTRPAPSPLAGEGWGGGSLLLREMHPPTATPTPNPSP